MTSPARKLDNNGEMSTEQAASYIAMRLGRSFTTKTLRNYLAMQQGPRCIKRFGRLSFLAADLDAWIKVNSEVRRAMA